MPKNIVLGFATTNNGKVYSASESLKWMPIKIEWLNAEMDEPRGSIEEIAMAKLEQAVEIANEMGFEGDGVFVVDAGTFVAGLEWPGAFTTFELKYLGLEKILKIMEIEGSAELTFKNVLALRIGSKTKIFISEHKGTAFTTKIEKVEELEAMAKKTGIKLWSKLNAIWVPQGFDRPWPLLSEKEREYVRKRDSSVFMKMGEWVVRNYASE